MITFDHRVPGTGPLEWESLLASAPPLALPGPDDRVVVVAAHPDDESLGVGGYIAACTEAGVPTTLVVATDGRYSHPQSSTHSPTSLAALRRREVTVAAATLGLPDAPVILDFSDGSLAANVDQLAAALDVHLRDATQVLTTWEHDAHPDHEACARAVRMVVAGRHGVAHLQYPIWAWHWDDPHDPVMPRVRLRRFPLSAHARAAKDRATACHRSQYLPLSAAPGDDPVLPEHVLAHFRRDTEYVVADAPASCPDYFSALYGTAEDPWGLAQRFYERRKRAVVLASLPREHFERGFEPGCATGLLTERLAERCADLVAWDVAAAAVERTARRVDGIPGVSVARRAIPYDWPPGEFDLIVLSEVAYYCPELGVLRRRVEESLSADGVLIACHWRHPAPDHPQSAEAVHAALNAGLTRVVGHVEEDFVLDVWARGSMSVARTGGIIN